MSYNDGSYTRTLSYNGEGQVAGETLRLGGAPSAYTSTYSYDAYDRPLSTVYPDGEVVSVTGYSSRGMATGLSSAIGVTTTTLVDCVRYDAAGRLVRLRYAGGGPCTGGARGRRLYRDAHSLRVVGGGGASDSDSDGAEEGGGG